MGLFKRKKEVNSNDQIEKLRKELIELEEKAKLEAELKEKQRILDEQKQKEQEELKIREEEKAKEVLKEKVPPIKRKRSFFSRRLTEKEKKMLDDYDAGRILQIDNNIDNKLYFSERR